MYILACPLYSLAQSIVYSFCSHKGLTFVQGQSTQGGTQTLGRGEHQGEIGGSVNCTHVHMMFGHLKKFSQTHFDGEKKHTTKGAFGSSICFKLLQERCNSCKLDKHFKSPIGKLFPERSRNVKLVNSFITRKIKTRRYKTQRFKKK